MRTARIVDVANRRRLSIAKRCTYWRIGKEDGRRCIHAGLILTRRIGSILQFACPCLAHLLEWRMEIAPLLPGNIRDARLIAARRIEVAKKEERKIRRFHQKRNRKI